MSIAGADPADGMSTSTCGAMGIPLLAAKSCCVATGNAPPADTFCNGTRGAAFILTLGASCPRMTIQPAATAAEGVTL
jgi:hypothetical protein